MLLAGCGGKAPEYKAPAPKSMTWRRVRVGRIPIDMRGQCFGRLRVVDFAKPTVDGRLKWRCYCDPALKDSLGQGCGTYVSRVGRNLRDGLVKSCGCLQRDMARDRAMRRNKVGRVAMPLVMRALETLRCT